MSESSTAAARPVIHLYRDNLEACVVAALNRLPIEDRERVLRRHGGKNALKQWRRDQRDAAIRDVADDCRNITAPTERAEEIRRQLALYAGGAYRFEPNRPPEDRARARMHRVLTLQNGRVPSFSTVWRALPGISPNGAAMK
jgi:transposase-like protein